MAAKDRTQVRLSAVGVASGTTGTETNINLVKQVGSGAPAAGAASIVVTAGKTLRITGMLVAARGHVTATAQVTTFSFRINPIGPVAPGSSAAFSVRVATPATSL